MTLANFGFLRARAQVQTMEASMWEERERSELAMEQLASQLGATQVEPNYQWGVGCHRSLYTFPVIQSNL